MTENLWGGVLNLERIVSTKIAKEEAKLSRAGREKSPVLTAYKQMLNELYEQFPDLETMVPRSGYTHSR